MLQTAEGGDNDGVEECLSEAQSAQQLVSVCLPHREPHCQHGGASLWIIDHHLSAARPLFALSLHHPEHR